MRNHPFKTFYLFFTILAFCACNLTGQVQPSTPTLEPTPVIEEASATPSAAPLPTETATPEATATLEATATETASPEPTLTETPGVVQAVVLKESNCRTGPGNIYDLIATYQKNQMLEMVAHDLGGGYVYVRNPEVPEEECWILEANIQIQGSMLSLPAFTPPPSPTAGPFFKATFKNFDQCKDDQFFARFTIVNTGGIDLKSGYVKVTDTKKQTVVENVLNAFDLSTGCIIAQNIAPLQPGKTGYLQSGYFKYPINGARLRAVVMACTDKNLKGVCITVTIDVKNK